MALQPPTHPVNCQGRSLALSGRPPLAGACKLKNHALVPPGSYRLQVYSSSSPF